MFSYALAPKPANNLSFDLSLRSSPALSPVLNPAPTLIPEAEWRERTKKIWMALRKWRWSLVERTVLGLLMAFTIVVPIATGSIVDRVVSTDTPLPFDATESQIEDRLARIRKAHLITLALVFAILLALWVPYSLWRLFANRKVLAILEAFNLADSEKASSSPNADAFIPLRWSLLKSSTFMRTATVLLSFPHGQQHASYLSGGGAMGMSGRQQGDGMGWLPPYVAKDPSPSPAYGYGVGGHPGDRATAA